MLVFAFCHNACSLLLLDMVQGMLCMIYSACKVKNTLFIFLHDQLKNFLRNPGGISPAFLQEILFFTMKLIDFAFTSHFSPAFLQAIFFFFMKFQILHSDNFSMKQKYVLLTLQALYVFLAV